jgi:hypothetical protein
MKPIAVLCSDIHLQERPPVVRSNEPSWWAAMQRPFDEIGSFGVPIFYAGDIFNHWRSPPELINWAIQHLPPGFAVPGQHDLPLHNLLDLHKSAFFTLLETGTLSLLMPDKPTLIGKKIRAWGFAWGQPLRSCSIKKEPDRINLAIVHAYVWRQGYNFPGATEETRVSAYAKALHGYDAAVFGDNHKGFTTYKSGCNVINAGTLMRRTIDEINYCPQVGLLMEDGTIEPYQLDCSEDKLLPRTEAKLIEEETFKMESFLQELEKLGHTNLDFRQAVLDYLITYKVSKAAQTILKYALDHAHD